MARNQIIKRKKCEGCGRVFEQALSDTGSTCSVCERMKRNAKPTLAADRWKGLVK